MSRGRTPRSYPQSRQTVRRAAEAALGRGPLVEPLEVRRLLTTLTGGQSFVYTDAAGNDIQITLTGNITAEFLAGRVPGATTGNYVAGRPVIRDLIPGGATTGADLFSIYVAEADSTASIYITGIDDSGPTPYEGSPGTANVPRLYPPANPVPAIDATGSVYLGARFGGTPITSVRNTQIYGVRPATRSIYAGIQTAAGVNLNNVFIAGVVTGIVNVEGSVNTFYAGGILTGDTFGLNSIDILTGLQPKPVTTNNFNIAGDLQNLVVNGSVGTNANFRFRVGTNVRIGGRLGNMHVLGNWYAQLQSRNASGAPPVDTPSVELETYFQNDDAANFGFTQGLLDQAQIGANDTPGLNSQFAYTDANNQMSWTGFLQSALGDDVDSYSLPLMAGQTTTLELNTIDEETGLLTAGASLQLLDPDGRVVASDVPGPTGAGANQQFQYTAKVPGIYSLVVSVTSAGGSYTLTANAAGQVPVGGVTVTGTTVFKELGNGVALRTGDLGAWWSGGDIVGDTEVYNGGIGSPINLSRGNLRALYSDGNLGSPQLAPQKSSLAGITSGPIDLVIPKGSVGHLRSGANMVINPSGAFDTNEPIPDAAIAGDYQRVEAGGDLTSNIIANGRIGTIVAGSINGILAPGGTPVGTTSVIAANADQRGSDGTIDMIYSAGNFGSAGAGGPGLFNGLDGNIKYVYAGGEVFRDGFFGAATLVDTFLEAGRAINFVDDSGARAVVRPTNVVTTGPAPAGSVAGTTVNPITGATTIIAFDPLTSTLTQTVTAPGALDYKGYGVRGVGGQVMINLHSTTSLDIVGSTVGQIDVGNIVTNGSGSAPQVGTLGLDNDSNDDGIPDVLIDINRGVTTTVGYPTDDTVPTDPNTPVVGEGFTAVAPDPNELNFFGPAEINVFHIIGSLVGTEPADTPGATTNITSINNFTTGEIASVDALNLGAINARTVGLMSGAAATEIMVPGNLTAAQPFNAFSRGINVTGPMIAVIARDGIGNVRSNSTINTINPNFDGKNARGVNDGINGAIRANVLNVVQIGEGIRFGGSGGIFESGLFAVDTINNVVGNNADIRGPIVANNYINSIVLTDGSIVNTRIGTLTGATPEAGFQQGLFLNSGLLINDAPSNLGFALNQILIRGNGGIIGADIEVGSFSNISVDGFGIIGSEIGSIAASNVNGQIVSGGFGIRASQLDINGSIRLIDVQGNGRVLSTASYNSRVNQSGGTRRLRFDPYSGRLLSGINDLNRYFGTSRSNPRLSGSTNSGVVADTQMLGQGTLGTLNAYAISTADVITTITNPTFPNRISFASNIGNINIKHTVSGLQLRTGKMDKLTIGTNLQRADLRVAGEVGDIAVGGTIRGTTNIIAQNANGQINSIVVKGGLYGNVTSRGTIGTIAADVIGAQIASSANIGRISTNGNVLTGTYIRAARNIDRVIIGGDFENDALIQADDVKVFRVAGANLGDLDEN